MKKGEPRLGLLSFWCPFLYALPPIYLEPDRVLEDTFLLKGPLSSSNSLGGSRFIPLFDLQIDLNPGVVWSCAPNKGTPGSKSICR